MPFERNNPPFGNYFSNPFYGDGSYEEDYRITDLKEALRTGSEYTLGIDREVIKTPAEIEEHTGVTSNIGWLTNIIERFKGHDGYREYLENYARGHREKYTSLVLPRHPFEAHSEKGSMQRLELTDSSNGSAENAYSFAKAIDDRWLDLILEKSETISGIRGRIYKLLENDKYTKEDDARLYYQIDVPQMRHHIFAGQATNFSGGGKEARNTFNAIMALVQAQTEMPIIVTTIGKRFAKGYQLLFEDLRDKAALQQKNQEQNQTRRMY